MMKEEKYNAAEIKYDIITAMEFKGIDEMP